MIVALFDVDGTLYTAPFGPVLAEHMATKGRKWQKYRYMASVMPLYLLSKRKLVKVETVQRAFLTGLSKLMEGCTEAEAAAAYHWMLDNALLPTQRVDVMARLREHQTQGHKVVLISGMIQPSLKLLHDRLDTFGSIGTEPEIVGGRYTGRTLLAVTGEDKATQARDFFRSRGMDVDWSASYAYGDSYTDHQMLELVGHPVAVYPDRKLHELAAEKKWEVFGTPK
jgi:HAD superfamily hydrolase (TIGR01490 family)